MWTDTGSPQLRSLVWVCRCRKKGKNRGCFLDRINLELWLRNTEEFSQKKNVLSTVTYFTMQLWFILREMQPEYIIFKTKRSEPGCITELCCPKAISHQLGSLQPNLLTCYSCIWMGLFLYSKYYRDWISIRIPLNSVLRELFHRSLVTTPMNTVLNKASCD